MFPENKDEYDVHFYYQAQILCKYASPVFQPADCHMKPKYKTFSQATCTHCDMAKKNYFHIENQISVTADRCHSI